MLHTHFNKESLIKELHELKLRNKSIGFVPTMGALHRGHGSLIEQAMRKTDKVVVSIFVNPTQFNKKDDLEKYPRVLERDIEFLEGISTQNIILYAPQPQDLYGAKVRSEVFEFGGIENEMEGEFRPGHFDGVATVVKKLFEIVKPDFAFFGEKDFQQLQIIRRMVKNHKIPVTVVGCEIFRESTGLAMSSRNERLKEEYKKASPFIFKILKAAKAKFGTKSAKKVSEWVENQFKKHPLLKLEYFTIADEETLKPIKRKSKQKKYRAFIAAYADDIRLIDNIALN